MPVEEEVLVDDGRHERAAMLVMLQATCEKALQLFEHGSGESELVSNLTRIVEHARRELDGLAEDQPLDDPAGDSRLRLPRGLGGNGRES